MAKEQQPRTFEEYNFQEFLKTKQENDTLKNENEELKGYVNDLLTQDKELIKLCKQVANIITCEKEDDDSCKTIRVGGNFAGLVFDDDIKYAPLVKFLDLIKAIPTREE